MVFRCLALRLPGFIQGYIEPYYTYYPTMSTHNTVLYIALDMTPKVPCCRVGSVRKFNIVAPYLGGTKA